VGHVKRPGALLARVKAGLAGTPCRHDTKNHKYTLNELVDLSQACQQHIGGCRLSQTYAFVAMFFKAHNADTHFLLTSP
jgi:hypothetical protein